MKCLFTSFLFIAFLALPLYAAETVTWQECVREATYNHPDLRSAAAQVSKARASKEVTRSAVLPTITGTASEVTSKGATFGSSGPGTGDDVVTGNRRTQDTSYEYGIEGRQLVFDGFKTAYQLSGANREISSARYNYDVTSSNVRLRLRTAYVNLLVSQELLAISRGIEARRRETLDLVTLRYEGGREHRGSLMTSEADLAQATFDVAQAERAIYLAGRQLTKELGRRQFIPMRAEGGLAVADEAREQPDFDLLCETNPLLMQLVAKKEAAKFGILSAKAQFFPTVYVTGNVSNTNIDHFPDRNEWSIGSSLSMPFFDGGKTIAAVKEAQAAFGQAAADERSGRDGVVYTLSDAWVRLQDALDAVGVAEKTLAAAEERARISESEYAIGLLGYDNWIIIENNLVQAKRELLNVKREALIAEATWIQAKGETLDYDGD